MIVKKLLKNVNLFKNSCFAKNNYTQGIELRENES